MVLGETFHKTYDESQLVMFHKIQKQTLYISNQYSTRPVLFCTPENIIV